MIDFRGRGRTAVRWAIVAGVGLAALVAEARADRIVLRGGGQVRGKLSPDPKRPDRVIVLTERGKTPLSFQKVQIVEVIAETGPLDDYLPKRDAAPATAEGQFELGEWCEQHKLPDLASVHYEAAIAHDKTFGPAHRKLGHVRYDDRWLTPDERREAQGLVRFKGRWITREEKTERDKDAALFAEQETWVRRLRLLREAIVHSSEDRQREAESQLMAIREPIAIQPLFRVFGHDEVIRMRLLLAHVLGAIPGSEATSALVAYLLDEGEAEVRNTTMDELLRRKESEVTKLLVRALHSKSPEVVNRAAWGLSNLNAISAVPSLIGALVSVRYEVVMAPSSSGSSEGQAISATFGSGPAAAPATNGGAAIAYNGSSTGYATGLASGPGSLGFGASSVPVYPVPSPPSVPPTLGMNTPLGGSSSGGSRGSVPRMIAIPFRNVEVLAALVKLTGNDFGWDTDTWNRWLRTSYSAEPKSAKRVPQP